MSEVVIGKTKRSDESRNEVDRFLGRCAHCLDNAYIDKECREISNNNCLIRRGLEMEWGGE